MLTKLEIDGRNQTLELPLIGGTTSGDPIQIRDIQGLEPVAASVNTSPFGSVDGESYSGSNIGKRNIVLTLGLNPNWQNQTMSTLRHQLYAYFMTKQQVTLRFFSTLIPTVEIVGYVESCEPKIFSRDPEMVVSIVCPLPDFVDIEPTVVEGSVGSGPDASIDISYLGTVPVGFVVDVEYNPSFSAFTGLIDIMNRYMDESVIWNVLSVNTTIDEDEFLRLSTGVGEKYVWSIGIGVTNLLPNVSAGAKWGKLKPGNNEFVVVAPQLGHSWTLTYFNRFGGL